MRKFLLGIMIVMILAAAAGCAGNREVSEISADHINVVTTIFPLADIIRELGGDRVSVSYLLPAGASPHTYEPTVEQARSIAGAHLFVYVGAGLDEWAYKLTEAAGPDLAVVELAAELDLLESGHYYHLAEPHDDDHHHNDHADHKDEHHDDDVDHKCHDHHKTHDEHHEDDDDHESHNDEHHEDHEHHEHHEHGHHDDHCHDHGPHDPHFWLDPVLVRDEISPRLFEELSLMLPDHTPYFEERLDRYRQQLTMLHDEITGAVSGFTRVDFISFHSAWQYFAWRYGLREVAIIAEFPGQEPSAGWVAELVELIKEQQIGAILTEPQFSPALAERIAEESGTKVLVIDPLGGENIPGRTSYLELMRFNLAAFKEALQ